MIRDHHRRGLVGGIAMFVIGFIFFGDAARQRLRYRERRRRAGRGGPAARSPRTCPTAPAPIMVPSHDTPAQTEMYGSGPIATVHYNTGGFAATDTAMLAAGLHLQLRRRGC